MISRLVSLGGIRKFVVISSGVSPAAALWSSSENPRETRDAGPPLSKQPQLLAGEGILFVDMALCLHIRVACIENRHNLSPSPASCGERPLYGLFDDRRPTH